MYRQRDDQDDLTSLSKAHYGENWTDEDKRVFDAMVREEMEKLDSGFKNKVGLNEDDVSSGSMIYS